MTADYLVKKVEIKFAILLDICMVESQSKFNLTEDSLIDYNVLSITTEGALS